LSPTKISRTVQRAVIVRQWLANLGMTSLINYEASPRRRVVWKIRAYMDAIGDVGEKYANDTGGFVRFDQLHSSDPNSFRC